MDATPQDSMALKRVFSVISICCALTLMSAASYAQAPSNHDTDAAPAPPAKQAGPTEAIAAIVNDSVITTYDVRQRMRLMLLSTQGKQIPPEAMQQLQQQALRDLVEEKLKLQEAKQWEFKVDDGDVMAEVQQMAAEGGLTVDLLKKVLASNGISFDSLRNQIKAGIVWPRLVQARYGRQVRINDDDVEATLERMREDATKEQYLVSEICLAVDDPSRAQAYYQAGLQLIEQMRKGVPFTVVAQQFSSCTTAAAGGDLGWVHAGELPPELDRAVKALPTGAVTNPIPSEGAFIILAVRDKREAVVPGEPSFTFAYAGAPLSMGENAARQALEKLPAADACGGRAQRQDLGPGVGVALIENMTIEDVDPRFRSAVEDLDRGDMSPVIEADGALHAVYVCDKDDGLGLPSRDSLVDRMYSRRLSQIAQRYLRDVEREATVDIRLGSPTAAAKG